MSNSNQLRSLQQWLNQHTNADGKATGRHDADYENWNVKRPSDEATKLIRAMLVRLNQLHASGESHGALFDPKNYLIRRLIQNPRDWKYEIQFCNPKNDNLVGSLEDRQAHDTLEVMNIIFGSILPDEASSYAPDIQHLRDGLETGSLHMIFLANHPSLWGWRERFFFFSKVMLWGKFGYKRALSYILRFVKTDYNSWKDKLQSGTPLHMVSQDSSFSYGNSLPGLVRFIRNVYEHVTENDRSKEGRGRKKYIDNSLSSLYSQEKFVENEVTKLFPLLLVELCHSLYDARIIILD